MLTALLITFVSLGGLCALLAIPLILRRIGPNWLYGLRTTKTMRDSKTWYDANAYAGNCLVVAGIFIASFPVILYLVLPNLHPAAFAIASAAVVLIAVLVTVVQSLRYLNTLA
jgi:uncharacterized membrane protein